MSKGLNTFISAFSKLGNRPVIEMLPTNLLNNLSNRIVEEFDDFRNIKRQRMEKNV